MNKRQCMRVFCGVLFVAVLGHYKEKMSLDALLLICVDEVQYYKTKRMLKTFVKAREKAFIKKM